MSFRQLQHDWSEFAAEQQPKSVIGAVRTTPNSKRTWRIDSHKARIEYWRSQLFVLLVLVQLFSEFALLSFLEL